MHLPHPDIGEFKLAHQIWFELEIWRMMKLGFLAHAIAFIFLPFEKEGNGFYFIQILSNRTFNKFGLLEELWIIKFIIKKDDAEKVGAIFATAPSSHTFISSRVPCFPFLPTIASSVLSTIHITNNCKVKRYVTYLSEVPFGIVGGCILCILEM